MPLCIFSDITAHSAFPSVLCERRSVTLQAPVPQNQAPVWRILRVFPQLLHFSSPRNVLSSHLEDVNYPRLENRGGTGRKLWKPEVCRSHFIQKGDNGGNLSNGSGDAKETWNLPAAKPSVAASPRGPRLRGGGVGGQSCLSLNQTPPST